MFKNPFSFKGRIRRKEYALSFLVFFACIGVVGGALADAGGEVLNFVGLLFIPLFWFLWAQGVKRSHDRGHSGWWLFIPFYGFALFFEESQVGSNVYGPNPKAIGMQDDEQDEQKNLF